MGESAEIPEIVFIGAAHYSPNEEAVKYFHESIWNKILSKRLSTTFGAVGGHPIPSIRFLSDDQFKIIGYVREILPYFQSAKLLVVPLLSGGGTRIKILEAFASGIPVVTTSLGVEGIEAVDGKHCLIRDDPDEFADACLSILTGPEKYQPMVKSSRKLVTERYDWESIGRLFVASVEKLVKMPNTCWQTPSSDR